MPTELLLIYITSCAVGLAIIACVFTVIAEFCKKLFGKRKTQVGTKPAQKVVSAKEHHNIEEARPHVQVSDFERRSPCLGTLRVGNQYIETFDAGTVTLTAEGQEYIRYGISGYGQRQREITYVDILWGENVTRYDLTSTQDGQLLMQRLDYEIKQGGHMEDALHFKQILNDLAKFNQYLLNGSITIKRNEFVWNY